jgi:hypothetical protein
MKELRRFDDYSHFNGAVLKIGETISPDQAKLLRSGDTVTIGGVISTVEFEPQYIVISLKEIRVLE